MEEARKYLLNAVKPEEIKPEQVFKDAQAVELMLRTYPWKVIESAIWRRLNTSIQASLRADTVEKREAARNKVLGQLEILHLPFELSAEKERIEKMREMTRQATNAL